MTPSEHTDGRMSWRSLTGAEMTERTAVLMLRAELELDPAELVELERHEIETQRLICDGCGFTVYGAHAMGPTNWKTRGSLDQGFDDLCPKCAVGVRPQDS